MYNCLSKSPFFHIDSRKDSSIISASILDNSGLLRPLDRQVLLYNENNRNGSLCVRFLKKLCLIKYTRDAAI